MENPSQAGRLSARAAVQGAGRTLRVLPRLVLFLGMLLAACLGSGTAVFSTGFPAPGGQAALPDQPARRFLHDRVADVTGARPLSLAQVATPTGLTGRGQIIGLADSGLDSGSLADLHPDLQSLLGRMPKVVMLKSWAGRSVPDDPNGHGTHMAATIAGTGKASAGKFRGLAPEASLYFQAILDQRGEVNPPAKLADLFTPAYAAGVRVHVDGWGGGLNEYREAAAQIDAFSREHPDFLAVFGAGNAGPARGSLTAEANAKNALVVGASGNPRPALDPQAEDTDKPLSFSSRGPAEDGRLKPELLAPGQAVVSARSRLVEGNFPANRAYAVMGGTSMAAAVAGGSLALLRQYLQTQEELASPSAALLKALLINGARVPPEGPGQDGFGVLDLAATILSLKEKSFRYLDARAGLAAGEAHTEYLKVEGSHPLKVTLVWTDPPGDPGRIPALVNDLDLIVRAPDGRVYYGNHFLHPGSPDKLNNVEQVCIPHPLPGTYAVTVRAAALARNAVAGARQARQDYALVWGQGPLTGILASWEAGKRIVLAGGESLPWPSQGQLVVDDQSLPLRADHLLPGADVYVVGGKAYIFARTWQASAGQAVPSKAGVVLMEADARRREGGYLLHPQAQDLPLVNGAPASDLTALPPGGRVWASVNPSSQRLWQIKIDYQEKKGYLNRIDLEKRQLWLIGDSQPYSLAAEVAVSFTDHLADASFADAPFAAAQEADLHALAPGMSVRLVLDKDTGEVNFLAGERSLAVGRLREARPAAGEIVLETGRTYRVFPNSPVLRDGEASTLAALQPGDHLTAVLLPGENQIVNLTAYSQVSFGRVLYAGTRPKALYFVDELNRFRTVSLASARLFRWGQPVEVTALAPGSWVRLVLDPAGKEAWRADAAETVEEKTGIFASYDASSGRLRLADGSLYPLSAAALITKQGFFLGPQDLAPGERVRLAVLAAPPPWGRVVAGIQLERPPEVASPRLSVQARPQDGGFILSGTTSADRLYLYRASGQRYEIPVGAGGYFASFFALGQREETVQVVGLSLARGGLVSQKITARAGFAAFADVSGHWAESDITALARAGLLGGYQDGTFRPERPVTRAEVVAVLVRLLGLEVVPGAAPAFADAQNIAPWAKAAVAAAQGKGLVVGYPDGAFRPEQPVTRAELAAFLARLLAGRAPLAPSSALPYVDQAELPAWAKEAVAVAYARGLLRGREGGRFAPQAPVTRAEMAAAFNRLLPYLGGVN